MTQIQAVIRKLRIHLSQSEISRLTGIAQPKISRWEAGKVAAGAEEALKLAALANQYTADSTKKASTGAAKGVSQ